MYQAKGTAKRPPWLSSVRLVRDQAGAGLRKPLYDKEFGIISLSIKNSCVEVQKAGHLGDSHMEKIKTREALRCFQLASPN